MKVKLNITPLQIVIGVEMDEKYFDIAVKRIGDLK